MKTSTVRLMPAALCLLLPLAAHAAPAGSDQGIRPEIRQEMVEARKEVRLELAQARRELETGNLSLGDGLRFGDDKGRRADLPKAEITPQGDFLIEGKAQAVGIGQRRQLLLYRGLVIEIARTGIDIGERSAEAALDAVGDSSVLGLMFGAFTGGLERRIERLVNEQVAPGVRGICRQLPRVLSSQQQLASSLPSFRPYATLEQDDIRDCERDVRNEFASL